MLTFLTYQFSSTNPPKLPNPTTQFHYSIGLNLSLRSKSMEKQVRISSNHYPFVYPRSTQSNNTQNHQNRAQ